MEKISKFECQELRALTGYSLMDCKKALDENNKDRYKAIKWLENKINKPHILK